MNGKLTSITDIDSQSGLIVDIDYTYDKEGNTLTEDTITKSIANVYDDLYQLKDSDEVDGAQQVLVNYDYAYDDGGNVESIAVSDTTSGPATMISYGTDNRIIAYDGQSVTHDADGNMTYGPLEGVFETYTYDERNRLTSVGGTSYGYDAMGKRISKTVGTDVTEYVNSPNGLSNLLMKVEPKKITYYIYGMGLVSEIEKRTERYYHFDGKGNTVALSDGSGNVTDTFEYTPFGEVVSPTGTNEPIFLFAGRMGIIKDDNDLYYMRARYYSTDIQRFITRDSYEGMLSKPLTLNNYAYGLNNPFRYVDPSGFDAEDIGRYNNRHVNSEPFDVHQMLDVAGSVDGLMPSPADACDGINAILYTFKGDMDNAYISYLAIGFDPAVGARYVDDVVDEAAEVFTKGTSETGKNLVYLSKNADDAVQYVGITNNYARRAADHLRTKGINIEPLMQNLTRSDARAVEQVLIEYHGLSKNGGTLINKINSISTSNPVYGESLERGLELLKSIGYLE